MDAFLQIFGEMKVVTVVVGIAALVFLWKIYNTVRKHMIEKYKQEEEKEQKIQAVIDQASHYPEWHKQSLDIQKMFSESISEVRAGQAENSKLLEKLSRKLAETETTTCRYRILRFNDEILHDCKHSKEHFDQILDDITQYEKYCEEHSEYENNKAVLAIENIKRIYQKCSNESLFL